MQLRLNLEARQQSKLALPTWVRNIRLYAKTQMLDRSQPPHRAACLHFENLKTLNPKL